MCRKWHVHVGKPGGTGPLRAFGGAGEAAGRKPGEGGRERHAVEGRRSLRLSSPPPLPPPPSAPRLHPPPCRGEPRGALSPTRARARPGRPGRTRRGARPCVLPSSPPTNEQTPLDPSSPGGGSAAQRDTPVRLDPLSACPLDCNYRDGLPSPGSGRLRQVWFDGPLDAGAPKQRVAARAPV